MADTAIFRQGNTVTLNIPASSGIAVWTQGKALIYQIVQGATIPTSPQALLATATAGVPYSSGVFSAATKLVIENFGEYPVFYNVGLTPRSLTQIQSALYQPTPATLNATGALTGALIMTGIVTSTTAAAVVATLDTGTVMDTNAIFAVGDCFDWSAVATGANSFTVTAAATHTLEGSGVVATGTSGHFRTRKTAANTFVTTRMS